MRKLPQALDEGSRSGDTWSRRCQVPAMRHHELFEACGHCAGEARIRPPGASHPRRQLLWLYIPNTTHPENRMTGSTVFPCAPALADWSSASTSQNPDIELHVMSSGKLARRRPSWPGWKTRPWITRLSGTMSGPSMAARGVEGFISCLPDIPANRSLPAAGAEARTIRATCGRTSRGSSRSVRRSGCSAKTSRDTWTVDLRRSPGSYRAWALASKRACSRRLKSARPTSGTGSSYWPTPTTTLYGNRAEIRLKDNRLAFLPAADQTGSQHALGQAARIWTLFFSLAKAMGLKPVQVLVYPCSRPLHVTLRPGTRFSPGEWTFNPNFSDWIMGWPIGWSDTRQPVTEWSLWRQRMRTELSRLLSRDEGRATDV